MAGASLEITPQGIDELYKAIDTLILRGENLSSLYADIGEHLLLSHEERWDKQVSPEGAPWEPLSDAYLRSKRKRESRGRNKILVLDSYLRNLNYSTDHSGLELGTNKIYGATHQFGDEDRGIPARPFLGI